LQEIPSPIFPSAFNVIIADCGCSRYCSLRGACKVLNELKLLQITDLDKQTVHGMDPEDTGFF
jgi:hypothetical protein